MRATIQCRLGFWRILDLTNHRQDKKFSAMSIIVGTSPRHLFCHRRPHSCKAQTTTIWEDIWETNCRCFRIRKTKKSIKHGGHLSEDTSGFRVCYTAQAALHRDAISINCNLRRRYSALPSSCFYKRPFDFQFYFTVWYIDDMSRLTYHTIRKAPTANNKIVASTRK